MNNRGKGFFYAMGCRDRALNNICKVDYKQWKLWANRAYLSGYNLSVNQSIKALVQQHER